MEGGERNEGGTEGRRDRGLWKRVAPIHLHRYGQDVDMLHLYRTLEGGREGGRGEGGREGGRGEGGRGERERGREEWMDRGREREIVSLSVNKYYE